MRTRAWLSSLVLVAVAAACGDQLTEVVPDRNSTVEGAGTVALATASSDDGLVINTDKDDYAPGDTVWFTGSGWPANDTLDIVLTDAPLTHPPHEWWVPVDGGGAFRDSTYVVDEGDLNVTFTLTATSRATGRTLTVSFTDGQPTQIGLTPTSQTILPGGSASYTVNVTMGGSPNNCTVTLEVTTALPSGATASFTTPNPTTGQASFSRTLTINTTGATTPGNYTFTVRPTKGSDCQGGATPTANGTLIVLGPASKLGFGVQPTSTTGGATISPAVTVRVLDANNNLIASSSASVSVALGNASGATLSGTFTRAAENGVVTFDDLSVNKIGNNYTLQALSSGLTDATSSAFNITLGPASQLIFTTQPAGATENVDFTTQPVLAITDAGGNPRTTGTGSGSNVELSIESGTGISSAVVACDDNTLNAAAGVASFTGCAIDEAGTGYRLHGEVNVGGAIFTATSAAFNVAAGDNAAPTIDCTVPDQTIWYGADLTVNCTASDGSGLQNASLASFSLSTSVAPGTETSSAATNSQQVCDTKGNCATAGPYTFKVDKKAPEVTCGSADGAWHATDVSISCTATDGGSGLAGTSPFTLSTNVASGTETNNASTNSQSVADIVGNSSTAGPVAGNKVDKKAPVVSCGSADGAWHAADVTISCTATDGGSGLAGTSPFTLSTSVSEGSETDAAATNSESVEDNVGNSVTAGPVTGNKVDKKGPQVTLTCPVNVILGSSASASWTAVDGGSGVATGYALGSITGLVTSSIGQHTATAPKGTSIDQVTPANESPAATCNYSVIYDWTGFFQPVDNNNLNVAKAGSAIPVKFNLGGNQGLNIFSTGYPASKTVACGSIDASTDNIEETWNAGGSSLVYDATAQQYVYVWKTEKSWASTCRRLDVKLIDGTVHSAYFKFKN
jgi:hypothetical protein